MGWARLHFINTGSISIGNVMRDIVGVIAGDISTTDQLQHATASLSEITNSAQRGNWTKVFPSTLTNTIPQVLSTTCLNGTTKFIQITSAGSSDAVNNTENTNSYGHSTSQFFQGIVMRSITTATSATNVSNPSFVNVGANVQTINYITGGYIWLSWSSRHCLIIGDTRGSTTTNIAHGFLGATGCFEFNELSLYDYRNTAPFCHAQWFDTSAATDFHLASSPVSGSTRNSSSFYIMNHFNPVTTTATGALNFLSTVTNAQYMPVTATAAGSYPNNFTKNSSGQNAAYLQPLFFHQHQIGIPHMYISDFAKVYRTQPNIGATAGDTFAVGTATYVYYDLMRNNTGLMALAVLKA